MRSLGGKHGYQLSNGDVLRIGRITLRVYDMGGFENSSTQYNATPLATKLVAKGGLNPSHNSPSMAAPPLNVEEVAGQSLQCRICLAEEPEDNNPLISPCRCTGTMANVHLYCLQRWLFNKVVTRDHNGCKTYSL